MRCLALAESLRASGHDVGIVSAAMTPAMKRRITQLGIEFFPIKTATGDWQQGVDAELTASVLRGFSSDADWVIVDHYGLDRSWESVVRRHSSKLMVIDDLADRSHECDLLLDTGYCVGMDKRYAKLATGLPLRLLGPKYSMLRDEFAGKRMPRKVARTVENVFVSYGGTDPTGETLKALEVARQMPTTGFCVVVGEKCEGLEQVQKVAATLTNVTLHIQTNQIAELLSNSDVALGAGGTSTWERFALGVPAIVTTVANNQIPSISKLAAEGYLEWLGASRQVSTASLHEALKALAASRTRREQMVCLGQKLVDGRGTERITRALESFTNTPIIRSANLDDARLYYQWTMDPLVRSQSFNSMEIQYEDHCRWFQGRIEDPDCQLFVGEIGGQPVGQVRFEQSNDSFTLSYSLDQKFRGRGMSQILLREALLRLNHASGVTVAGETRPQNMASVQALIAAGFHETNSVIDGIRTFILEL